MKPRYGCDNSFCMTPQPFEVAQELNGKKLCWKCYNLGIRLVPSAVAKYPEKLINAEPK